MTINQTNIEIILPFLLKPTLGLKLVRHYLPKATFWDEVGGGDDTELTDS